ncbi:hypothetical protein RchiOBHm_Chr2g0111041 [Rosa chinensis]|uniref:Uncharacterized protein n=1 Tax=Rosa chinensis TaxID=74649 RepID=A0A2P6RPU6_ROSCH|nr:hypothetical protein RchiOBHm_Chr2g0111041 [Rosa chinensis]
MGFEICIKIKNKIKNLSLPPLKFFPLPQIFDHPAHIPKIPHIPKIVEPLHATLLLPLVMKLQ